MANGNVQPAQVTSRMYSTEVPQQNPFLALLQGGLQGAMKAGEEKRQLPIDLLKSAFQGWASTGQIQPTGGLGATIPGAPGWKYSGLPTSPQDALKALELRDYTPPGEFSPKEAVKFVYGESAKRPYSSEQLSSKKIFQHAEMLQDATILASYTAAEIAAIQAAGQSPEGLMETARKKALPAGTIPVLRGSEVIVISPSRLQPGDVRIKY